MPSTVAIWPSAYLTFGLDSLPKQNLFLLSTYAKADSFDLAIACVKEILNIRLHQDNVKSKGAKLMQHKYFIHNSASTSINKDSKKQPTS